MEGSAMKCDPLAGLMVLGPAVGAPHVGIGDAWAGPARQDSGFLGGLIDEPEPKMVTWLSK
jgi:hypothetical protein